MMLQEGEIELLDNDRESIPAWRWWELLGNEATWAQESGYFFRLTAKGVKNIG